MIGLRITYNGAPAMVAETVQRNLMILQLENERQSELIQDKLSYNRILP